MCEFWGVLLRGCSVAIHSGDYLVAVSLIMSVQDGCSLLQRTLNSLFQGHRASWRENLENYLVVPLGDTLHSWLQVTSPSMTLFPGRLLCGRCRQPFLDFGKNLFHLHVDFTAGELS